MAEIRLICPDCGTEYQIPETAVPEGGREVECSECGRIWRAQGLARPKEMGVYSYNFAEFKGLSDPAPAAVEQAHLPDLEMPASTIATPDAAAPGPAAEGEGEDVPLNRRLPENVMNILLEEVEHERQAREADEARAANPDAQAVTARADDMLEEPDWPATTVTGQWRNRVIEKPIIPDPAPADTAAAETPKDSQPMTPTVDEPDNGDTPMNTLPVLAAPRLQNGYWQGMGVAAAIAATVLAIYIITAPTSSDGFMGGIRHGLDQARLWLQNAAEGPKS